MCPFYDSLILHIAWLTWRKEELLLTTFWPYLTHISAILPCSLPTPHLFFPPSLLSASLSAVLCFMPPLCSVSPSNLCFSAPLPYFFVFAMSNFIVKWQLPEFQTLLCQIRYLPTIVKPQSVFYTSHKTDLCLNYSSGAAFDHHLSIPIIAHMQVNAELSVFDQRGKNS